MSPEVVLEVDHIVPVAGGGSDDTINLVTACWECNRGKSNKPLSEAMTGEDPHDKAVLLLERERQLREYNAVLAEVNERVRTDTEVLCDYWKDATGRSIYGKNLTCLENLLRKYPYEMVSDAIEIAIRNGKTSGLAYAVVVLKNRTA